MIAHALLLAAWRLRRVALRPVGGSAMHDRARLPVDVMLFVLMMPVIVPALVPFLGLMAVGRLLFGGMTCLCA